MRPFGMRIILWGSASSTGPLIYSWKSTAATTAWATDSNWDSEFAPANDLSSHIAIFSKSSYLSQPNAGTRSVRGVDIGDGTTSTASLTLSGTALSIGTYGIMMYPLAGTATISSALSLANDLPVDNDSSSLMTISGGITGTGPFKIQTIGSGSGGLTFSGIIGNGTGTTSFEANHTGQVVTLSGVNTFTGGVLVKKGVVYGTTSASCFGAGNVTIGDTSAGAAEIGINANIAMARPITVGGMGTNTLTFTTTGASVTGGITANQSLTVISTLTAGTVTISTGAITGSGNLTFNPQRNNTSLGLTVSSAVSTTGSITTSGLGQTNFSGIISNISGLTVNGPTRLSGVNTFTTPVVLNAGELILGNAAALGTNTLTINGGSVAAVGAPTITNAISIQGDFSTNLFQNGLAGTNMIWSGAVTLGKTVAINDNFTGGNTHTISGIISDGASTFGITKNGGGNITLSGNNSYKGTTTINGGIFTMNGPTSITGGTILNSGQLVSNATGLGTGSLTINGGQLTFAAANTNNNSITLNSNFTMSGSGGWGTGNVTLGANIFINQSIGPSNVAIGGIISDGGNAYGLKIRGVGNTGGGSINLTGASTFTGTLQISGGEIDLGGSTATGSLSSALILRLLGGKFSYTRTGTNSQSFASTSLALGSSLVGNTRATNTLTLGTITRATGAALHATALTGAINVSNANDASGILGPWASAASPAQYVTGGGNLGLYTGTAAATPANMTDTTGTVNYELAAVGSAPASMNCHTIRPTSGITGTIAPGATQFAFDGFLKGFAGALTIGTNPITIGNTGEMFLTVATGGSLTISSPVNGTGDLILNNVGAGGITISGNINNTGRVICAGSIGANNTNNLITGGIGSNVTEVIVASEYARLTIQTAGLVVNAGGTTLRTSEGSYSSSQILSITSGVTGTGNLTIATGALYTGASFSNVQLSSGTVNHIGSITNNGTGVDHAEITAVIGTNVTSVIQDSATSNLSLSGVNTFSGGITVRKGILRLWTSSSAAGTGTITLGDTTGAIDATVISTIAISAPLTVQSGNTGKATLQTTATYSGAITLSSHNLTLQVGRSSTGVFSGGITGTGNISLLSDFDGASMTISTGTVNHVGTISNDTANPTIVPGAWNAALSTIAISSTIGANVTGISQNSTGASMTISGTQSSMVCPMTVTAGYLIITGTTSASSAVAVNGGTLCGTGTASGTVTVANTLGATIKGGLIGQTGTLTLGNLVMSGANSGLDVDFTAASASSVSVSGTCALGGCRVNLLVYMPPGRYTILSSTGAMTGTLPVIGTNNSTRSATLSQSGNNLILTLV